MPRGLSKRKRIAAVRFVSTLEFWVARPESAKGVHLAKHAMPFPEQDYATSFGPGGAKSCSQGRKTLVSDTHNH